MGGCNIFKKDPAYYQNLLIKIDKKLAYVPGLCIITASVDLIMKSLLNTKFGSLSGRERLNNNTYHVYLRSKSASRSLLLFIPLFGNLLVALMDFSRNKSIQKEKKSQSPDLQFCLAKRYLMGDGVKRNVEKSQKLLNQALKDLNNHKVRSYYALQYLDHVFTSLDHPYSNAINLIKGIQDVKELSKLKGVCNLRAMQWENRVKKLKSQPQFDFEEVKEMNIIKQGYLNAAKFCDNRKEVVENPVPYSPKELEILQKLNEQDRKKVIKEVDIIQ